ncbi:MAG: C10 family peptidase [Bacteroidaceae bacterium]|nr:C10 family peptidase [Bacteroidaceae bacterium]
MKRVLLLMLVIVTTAIAMGQEVTPEQALQRAKKFMESHETTVNKQKRAAGKTSSLTMTSKVSGLYIFNVADDGGFVIVSNNERTVPILGFSDTGSFDPENIPDNMKAWLQGYADQIAWQEKQGTGVTVSNAPKRNATHSTNEIQPLIETKWDQGAPYNNKCPLYRTGYRSVTGCVATAMAQVMNYHQWPTETKVIIPGYTTDTYGLNLSSLPTTTFDWANMSNTYTNNTTGATAEAVATLMQYCGWAVEMDYGPSSGASSSMIAEALKNYFDYNNETTQFVSRSFYTADKWADLIYHELANKRPVLYGGMSSGGGHEFVCDGYRYEDGTDFFHINWGWGGESDQYFVLSALDPEQQGIGGSSSDDGFHYGQDAIIGIQSSEKSGKVASITPNVINLKVNSMTPSSNTSICYMPVNVTVNVTNRSSEDYDGDIYLGRRYNGINSFLEGSNYFIPAGETKDVVIPFIPTETGTYDIIYWLPSEGGYYTTNTQIYTSIEVTDATSNGFVPVYGYYCDQLSRSQFIIPKGNIEDLYNSTINGMTFYASTTSAIRWGNAQFDVYLKEVEETTFADNTLKDWSTLDKVYSGSLSIANDGKMTIVFNTPYLYNGGNLLVGINQTATGSYKACTWVGDTANGASLGGYSSRITQQNFLPHTTFDYTPGEAPAVQRPTRLTVNYNGGPTAEVRWTSEESVFDIDVNGTVIENVSNPYTLNDLEAATTYTVKVRAKNGNQVSEWSAPVTFTTEVSFDLCQITLELTDSYGDGWNGNAIQVVDVLTGTILATLQNTEDADANQSQTYSVDVPNDYDINFIWVSGDYSGECSYIVYDVNGEVILSGSGALSEPYTYHVNCTFAPKPQNLAVTPALSTATVSWTGNDNATSYNLRYRKLNGLYYDFESAEPWVVDNFAPFTTYDGDGLSTYGINDKPFTNQHYTGAVIAFQNGIASSFTAHGGNAFGCFMNNETQNNDWFISPEIEITQGDVFSFWARSATNQYGLERFKVGVYGSTDGTFDAYLADGEDAYIEAPLSWTKYEYDLSDYTGQTIRLAINCVSVDCFAFFIDDIFIGNPNVENEWIETITDVTSPYELTGLNTGTRYEVQVQAVYENTTSDWVGTEFTTHSDDDKPNTLIASDITHNTATLSWEGYQDDYNIRLSVPQQFSQNATSLFEQVGNDFVPTQVLTQYQFDLSQYSGTGTIAIRHYNCYNEFKVLVDDISLTNAAGSVVFSEDFENSTVPSTWANIDADGDSYTWSIGYASGTDSNGNPYFNGNYGISSNSYIYETPLTPDNWLVIPNVELGGTLSLYARASSNNYCNDVLGVFVITEDVIVPASTATIEHVTSPYTLENLQSGTIYEVQVQGNIDANVTTPWSTSTSFTTLDHVILNNEDDNSDILALYEGNGKTVSVTLQDRYLYRDGAWNTLCLPFNADKSGDFADATIMELNVEGTYENNKQTGFDTSDHTLYVFFDEVEGFTAGKPCIVKWNTIGEPIQNPTFTGVTITSTEPETVESANNGLNKAQFIGTYAPAQLEANTTANLYLDANNELCYPTVADFQVNAFRAYFTVDLDGQNSVNHFSLRFGKENATPVIALKADSSNYDSNEWYMIDGRKLNGRPTVKGLYIHGGRKVVIK